jgi:hypothetical protein
VKKSVLFDCLRMANQSLEDHQDQFKHFSFVIQENRIVALGKNRYTLHTKVRGYPSNAKIHSEVSALKRAHLNGKSGKKFSLVNIRINRFREFRRSKPCSCCEFYLRLFGCKEVWYTTYSGFERMRL